MLNKCCASVAREQLPPRELLPEVKLDRIPLGVTNDLGVRSLLVLQVRCVWLADGAGVTLTIGSASRSTRGMRRSAISNLAGACYAL